jgi:hypothetical protein
LSKNQAAPARKAPQGNPSDAARKTTMHQQHDLVKTFFAKI